MLEEIENLAREYTTSSEKRKEVLEGKILAAIEPYLRGFINKKFGSSTPDRMQTGRIAVLKAIRRFNLEMGCKFSTYATSWIIGSIKNERRVETIYPSWILELCDRLSGIEAESLLEGTRLTDDILCSRLFISHATLSVLRAAKSGTLNLDLVPDIRQEEVNQDSILDIKGAIQTLPRRLKPIVSMVYLQGMDITEAALLLEIHPKKATQLLEDAKALLRIKLVGYE